MNKLTTLKVSEIAPASESDWLVENFWLDNSCGIIAAPPKTNKTFFSLQLAVSVATGLPFLGKHRVTKPGRVLVLSVEDAIGQTRKRLDGICKLVGKTLDQVDIHLIENQNLKLDSDEDFSSLKQTISELKPKLLILDCFVRLHSGSENAAGHVSKLLGKLREIQRDLNLSVMLIHHMSKGKEGARRSERIRGSSDIFAFVDNAIYLEKIADNRLLINCEFRSAQPTSDLEVIFISDNERLGLVESEGSMSSETTQGKGANIERVLGAFRGHQTYPTVRALRRATSLKTLTLCHVVNELLQRGVLVKDRHGYRLIA